MSRVPWELKIRFPSDMQMVVLHSEYQVESPGRTRVIYRSSTFTLRIECNNCNVKPVDFKPSFRLQQLTLSPYTWDVGSDAVTLTLALLDAVLGQSIAGGRIALFLDDLPLPFVCEHDGMAYEMVVHSAQPNYARRRAAALADESATAADKKGGAMSGAHGARRTCQSKSRGSVRKNSRALPHFISLITPGALSSAQGAHGSVVCAEDALLREIHDAIGATTRLMQFFCLPSL